MELRHTSSDPTDSSCCSCVGSAPVEGCREVVSSLPAGAEVWVAVTVSPSPQSKDEENEKLHKLREYARDFRRQHTTDAKQSDWDSDDGDYGLAIGRLVVT
jgi:hypothetical protein